MAITEPLIPHRLTPWQFRSLGGIMMLAGGVVLFSLFGAVPVTVRYSNTASYPMVHLRSGSSQVWPNGGTNASSDLENLDRVEELQLLKQIASACAVGFIYNASEESPQKRCIPAPCDVANADAVSGPGPCVCRNGFHSLLAWSGVAWTGSCEASCVLPRSTTGYNTRRCATRGGAIIDSSCTVKCAAFFMGNASATCTATGDFALSGCEPFQFGLSVFTDNPDTLFGSNGWILVDSIAMLNKMKTAFIAFYNEHHLPVLASWESDSCFIQVSDGDQNHGVGITNKEWSSGHSMCPSKGNGVWVWNMVRGTQYMLSPSPTRKALTALSSSDSFVQLEGQSYGAPMLWYNPINMYGAPPSGEDLAVEVAAMKKVEAETKTGDGKADLALVAVYKKAYADNGGDKAKVCAALGLEEAKWPAGGEKEFLAKYCG